MHAIFLLILILFTFSFNANPVFAQESQPEAQIDNRTDNLQNNQPDNPISKQNIELPPVVITASRVEESVSQVPASVSVITPEDVKVKQVITLDEALRAVPGLTIQTFGGADPLSSVSLRGTEDNQSMVMIDGIKINSPYFQRPHIGALLLNTSAQTEVVKGSYSGLYGSEAIGGVVNIITREEPGLTYTVNGGNQKTFNGNLLYTGRHNDVSYTLGLGRSTTEGFEFSGPYWNNTFSARVNVPLNESASVKFMSNYWAWKKYDHTLCCEVTETAVVDGTTVPTVFSFILDKGANFREENRLNSIQLLNSPTDQWDYTLTLSMYSSDYHTDNPIEPATPARPFPLEINQDMLSERDTVEMQNNIYVSNKDTLTLGFYSSWEWLKKSESGNLSSMGMGPSSIEPDVKADRFSRAAYLQNMYKSDDRLSLTAGIRFENSPDIFSEIIPRASILYNIPATGTGVSIAYGEGIRAPSFNELYHPVQGNTGLEPEKSRSYEVGFKQSLFNKRIQLDATGFILRIRNLIDIGMKASGPVYVNTGRARITGTEANLKMAVTDKLETIIGYTKLSTEDMDTGEDLPLRPEYRWTWDLRYNPIKRLMLDLNAEFIGKALDPFDFLIGLDGNNLSKTASPYKVFNMAAAYNIINNSSSSGSVDFTLKLNNIFNEEYEETPGFRSSGFTFLAGIRGKY